MNKKQIALGVALSLASMGSLAVEVGIEANMLKPANQDVVLGTSFDTTGANDVLEPGTDMGFKLQVQDASWRVSLMKLSSKTDLNSTNNGDMNTSLDHPDSNWGTYNSLSASGEIEVSELGADYLIPLSGSSATKVGLATGLRYVNFESKLTANYDNDAQIINRKASNDLLGLRAGLEASRSFGALTVDAAFGMGLMFGSSDFSQTESNNGYVRTLSSNTMAPSMDAQIRVSYTVADAAKLWLGYELLQYSNVATQQIFVDDVNDATQIPQGINAGFHGMKAGFSWAF